MATISTSTGLISGIDSKGIIDQLMTLEARGKTLLQTRVEATTSKKVAFTDLQTRLTSLRLFATSVKKSSTFQNASATSGNEDVLTATASSGAAVGNYQFQVARLVTTQQSISNGFKDFSTTPVGAGTITLEQGGGELSSQTALSTLRGGKGVTRGQFRITDRSGNSAVIDTTSAVTIDDVLKKINQNLDITVKATLDGDKIKLTDLTGRTASNLIVTDLGEGTAASDLGIVTNTAANTSTGSDIQFLSRTMQLSSLNDNRGVSMAGGATADFQVATADGSTFSVALGGSATIGDVIDKINTASGGKITASIGAGDNGLTLTDNTTGATSFAVTALNSSSAASDLGLLKSTNSATLTGGSILAGINTTLLGSLRGGTGIPLGQISITDRDGNSATIDLAGSSSVQDILDKINNASGINITAKLKSSQNGISIVDDTGASGNLVISDVSGTSASVLGLAGTFASGKNAEGANLQKQWVTKNTLLSTFNGGKGVAAGKFKITNGAGASATVDLTQGNEIKVADVIQEINAKGIGITASINANGDGILVTDTSGGATQMKVEELGGGTTAGDLNIKGTATSNKIDGSWEKSITITATDKLSDVQTKINTLGYGMTASIINDGTADAPFRLSLTAKNSGRSGRVSIDGGATGISAQTLVDSQDAAVFLGGADTAQPLLITASKNQLAGIIPGVTVNLNGVSSSPVSLNISRSVDNVVEQANTFVENFNQMIDKINELTDFDTDTNKGGLLLGDGTVQQIQSTVYSIFTQSVTTGGKYNTLSAIGITLGDEAKVEFDEDKFRAAYATDPDSVSKLFTLTEQQTTGSTTKTINRGIGGLFEDAINKLIDPVNGVVTLNNKALDQTMQGFNDRISQMDDLLAAKRLRLETQFANMESVLATLQNQQSALGQITNISAPASKK